MRHERSIFLMHAPVSFHTSLCCLITENLNPMFDTGELLKLPIDNRRGLQAQPLLQESRIRATEVVVEVEIALQLILNLERRILAVHPTLHRVANDKGHAAGAVVCARPVVADATPKF